MDFKIIFQHESTDNLDEYNLKLTAKANAHAIIEQYVGVAGITSLNAKVYSHNESDHLYYTLYEVVVDIRINDKLVNLLKISNPEKYEEFRILTEHKLLRLGLF